MKKLAVLLLAAVLVAAMLPLSALGTGITGDVDGNGKVNNIDAMLILQSFAGIADVDNIDTAVSDVDGNGKVNNIDAMLVLQYFAGIIDTFPTEPSTEATEPSTEATEPEETEPSTEATEPSTEATEPEEDEGEVDWTGFKGPANISTGISWDGVSPIIYTYTDGTTGTERKPGATYEYAPGVYRTVPDVVYETTTKPGSNTDVRYCKHCGKQQGDGTNGTCARWFTGGDHTCPNCGDTVPEKTCHYCGEN